MALEINPKNTAALINKGNSLSELKKYEEAIKCYDKAIELDLNYSEVIYYKGHALFKLKKYDEAIKCYEKVIELEPESTNALYNKALTLTHLEKYTDAIRWFDKIIKKTPSDVEALYCRGMALEQIYYYEKAIVCYERVIEISPGYEEVWYRKGRCLADMERYEEAIMGYQKANVDTPEKYDDVMCHMGISYKKIGNEKEAKRLFDEVVKRNPNVGSGAMDAHQHKSYSAALELFIKKVAITPNVPYAYMKGTTEINLDKFRDGVESMDFVINSLKELTDDEWKESRFFPHFHRAKAFAFLGRFEDALADYDTALHLGKTGSTNQPFIIKARCHAELGQHQEALRFYHLTNPNDKPGEWDKNVLCLKSISYNEIGQHQEALESLELIPERYFEDISFLFQKGVTLNHLGRNEEGAKYFEKIIELSSNLDDYDKKIFWYIRASAFSKLDKTQEANECFEKSEQDFDVSRNWKVTRISSYD